MITHIYLYVYIYIHNFLTISMDIDVLYSFMLSCLNIYTHVSVCIDYCYRGDVFQTVKHCVLCDIFGEDNLVTWSLLRFYIALYQKFRKVLTQEMKILCRSFVPPCFSSFRRFIHFSFVSLFYKFSFFLKG